MVVSVATAGKTKSGEFRYVSSAEMVADWPQYANRPIKKAFILYQMLGECG
jgi:hypothetical protein